MKPLTKTVVNRGGGIAARFAKTKKPKFDRVAYQREYMRQWRAKRKK